MNKLCKGISAGLFSVIVAVLILLSAVYVSLDTKCVFADIAGDGAINNVEDECANGNLDNNGECCDREIAVATYTVIEGSVMYTETLQKAVRQVAGCGYSITLLKDVSENIVVGENDVVTLNLNGHTLTNDGDGVTITNNGNFTLEGEGSVDNVSGKAAFVNNGTATLNGGAFSMKVSDLTGEAVQSSDGYIISNNGSLTISGTKYSDFATQIESIIKSIKDLSDSIDVIDGNLNSSAKSDDSAKITAAQDDGISQINAWLDDYLRGLLGIKESENNYTVSLSMNVEAAETEEISYTDLEDMIDRAFNKKNASLVKKYYEDARVSISNASSVEEVTTAVAVYKAQVTTLEVMQENTTDNSGIYALVMVSLAVALIALLIVLIMWRKKDSDNSPAPAADAVERDMKQGRVSIGKSLSEKYENGEKVFVNPFENIRGDLMRQLEENDEEETDGKVVAIRRKVQQVPNGFYYGKAGEINKEEEIVAMVDENRDVLVDENEEAWRTMEKHPYKTFSQRMADTTPENRAYYSEIKNELLSYKKVNDRYSRKCESFRTGRTLLAKIVLIGKTLRLYLALDPKDYEFNVYYHHDESDKKAYEEVPLMVKLQSDRGIKKAKRLIAALMEKAGCDKKTKYVEIDYSQTFDDVIEEEDDDESADLSEIA
jgi:hypothetical protein